MLEILNLTIQITKDNRTLIDNLSFNINQNDKFAIIGLEGNGKSTLLKAIVDKSLISFCDVFGTIVIKGKIGYLEQSILDHWMDTNVIDFLLKSNPDSIIDLNDYQKLGHLDNILQKLKLNPKLIDENKKVSQYSGGELVKLGLTKILLNDSDILLLDEPTNDLDLETILYLEDFILSETKPILFVSHDEALLENTTNGIIHLSQIHKKTKPVHEVVKMNYVDYKEFRHIALDSQEMIARKQRSDYQKKMDRFRQIYSKVEYQQDQAVRNPTLGRLLKKKIHALKSMEKRLLKEKDTFFEIPEREEAIDLFFDKSIGIPNGKTILEMHLEPLKVNDRVLSKSVDISIQGNKKIAIIGRNGSGKSTLLKLIYEELLNRNDISVGYMSQEYEELISDDLNALDFILKGFDQREEARIRKMMGALQFTREEMVSKTSQLSGGQKAKLLLLKMVVNKNNVLLLDEPTRNLSPLSAPVIHELLIHFNGCVICITHDRKFLENVFEEVYELNEENLKKLI
ncbi:MAG: transporter, ATP-binding protein [Haloplasmataceae bacterium]|jgi:ATPase subunit of ABC transporter with duplicated ATPase domains|nr:transporter, ATP-binding protein [Haloplasmataceae bacterium]